MEKNRNTEHFSFFGFYTGFQPTNGGRLIRLMRRDMRTR